MPVITIRATMTTDTLLKPCSCLLVKALHIFSPRPPSVCAWNSSTCWGNLSLAYIILQAWWNTLNLGFILPIALIHDETSWQLRVASDCTMQFSKGPHLGLITTSFSHVILAQHFVASKQYETFGYLTSKLPSQSLNLVSAVTGQNAIQVFHFLALQQCRYQIFGMYRRVSQGWLHPPITSELTIISGQDWLSMSLSICQRACKLCTSHAKWKRGLTSRSQI